MKTFKALKNNLNEYYTVHVHDENDKPEFAGDPTKYSSSAVEKSLKHTQKGKTVTIKSKDHLGTIDSVVVRPGSYVKKYVDQLNTRRNVQKEQVEFDEEQKVVQKNNRRVTIVKKKVTEQHAEEGRFHPTIPYNVPNVNVSKPRHSGASRSKTYDLVKNIMRNKLKESDEECTEIKNNKDSTKNKKDKFQANPEINDSLVKTANQ